MSPPSRIPDHHRELVLEYLDATPPPESGPVLEVLAMSNFEILLGFGLLQRSRRYLKAMLILDQENLLDVCDAMARSVYEYSVTGIWMLDDPTHLQEFVRSYRRQLRLVQEWNANWMKELVDPLEDLLQESFGTSAESKLRPLELRIPPSLRKGAYFIYRELSARAHPTLLSALLPMDEDDEGYVRVSDQQTEWDTHPRDYPLMATLSSFNLARRIHQRLGIPEETLRPLGTKILGFLEQSLRQAEASASDL